jgi:hypothetical protein
MLFAKPTFSTATGVLTNYAQIGTPAFLILHRLPASLPRPGRQPRLANQLVNRVVQKASFQNPDFIGFFAPISKIRAGLLPTGF